MKQQLKTTIKSLRSVLYAGLFIAVSFGMTGCEKDYIYKAPAPSPNDTVYYNATIKPLLNDQCATSGCHDGNNFSPDLTPANSWNELINGLYVDPGNATSSILYQRMTSASDPMPPNGLLPVAQTDLVKNWILQGALNN